MLVSLISCGGNSQNVTSPATSSDREAPVIGSVTLEADASGAPLIASNELGQPTITLQVQDASDNIDVTAYCVTSSATRPAAASTCFSEQRSWTRTIGPTWHVWARDAAGNVSAALRAPGPCSAAAVAAAQASTLPTVCMRTDAGEIVIELEKDKAPISSNNFAQYVVDGFYAGTIFHRILAGTAVQGGGFTNLADVSSNKTKPGNSPIAIERTTDTGLSNLTGTIAMARVGVDTSTAKAVDSATSQFFINLKDNSAAWDANPSRQNTSDNPTAVDGYAVFGRIIFGYETAVSKIAQTPLNGDRPTTTIFIQWAYLLN